MFCPGHNPPSFPSATCVDNRAHLHSDVTKAAGQAGGHDDNNSDIETEAEAEWFDESLDDATKNPSQNSEVCFFLFYGFGDYVLKNILRYHLGTGLRTLLDQV